MITVILLSILGILGMFICVLKYPTIKLLKFKFDSFFVPLLFVALVLLILPIFDKGEFFNILFSNSNLNPLKILVLFICVSILSIFLDETGFFEYLANIFIKKYKQSQIKLFIVFYILISILTIFTSNDIIILTFTPFIIHFCKKGNISPIPYLVMQFVAANTYSMILPIGNPTNIYLTSVFEIDFFTYIKNMILPTLFCGVSSLGVLFVIFKKQLQEKIEVFEGEVVQIKNIPLCFISLIHLAITIFLLAISNYIGLDMWLICFVFAISLLIVFLIYSLSKKDYIYIKSAFRRIPYNLIPFILSMFTIIMALDFFGVFKIVYEGLNMFSNVKYLSIVYLISSTLFCNVVNNIPMSLAFGSILSNSSSSNLVYATIIGSNIGALLTPIGALAGIMWIRMLKDKNVEYSFFMFVKNGVIITLSLIISASLSLLFI